MKFEFLVYVRCPNSWDKEKKCSALGHQFYRCGNCRSMIRVFSEQTHDSECASCEWKIFVEFNGRD